MIIKLWLRQWIYFISQVKDKMGQGVLSQTNGQTLIDSANDVINSLNNQVR
jgi:hypothetical protein